MIRLVDLLKEITEGKQVGDVYHYTYLRQLPLILKSGKLRPSPERLKEKGYISFSRDRALGSTLGPDKSQVRITIDGNKLSNKYSISPYAQLKPETKRDKENWTAPFSRETQDSESELIISSKEYGGSIDILSYIKKIDIIDRNEREFSVGGSNFKNWKKEIEKLNKTLNIPIEFHKLEKSYSDSDDSFYSPQRNKTVK
jgi:hypothetical protein